ncbi:TlpA family protein disulfide reductase [Sphingobacterium daejeonense]|uniref:TlpA family protein disulfide reductase n=1 Tax=Sphingobacterium daejeonense TaxID=371142 RepID=UPI0021A27B51|nr:TlpA disulfide reductase family protein [Sphingobacterium daejeonense]MCT1531918.1 TlpA family protein disulfide reductase [Sphingobacterium daejeonense]
MKRFISIVALTIGLFLFCSINVHSQEADKFSEIKAFVDKWKDLKSVSYDAEMEDKNLFSDDTIRSFERSELFFDSTNMLIASKEINISEDWNLTNLYNGEKTYFIDNDKMSYTIAKRNRTTHKIFGHSGIIDSISFYLFNNKNKIEIMADTLIHGFKCSYFKFISYEVIKNGEKFYTYYFFAFDKNSYDPILYQEISRGQASAKGYSLGVINVFSKTWFKNVNRNNLNYEISNFSPPSTARIEEVEVRELLKKGDENPKWETRSLDGDIFNSADFKGKYSLLFLSVTDCPANQLSVKVINNMVDRFGKRIQVIGIYDEMDERLRNYIKSNHLKFPVIANGKIIKSKYNATGSPYYYLIDKDGKIFFSQSGYNEDLEGELIKNIEEMDR